MAEMVAGAKARSRRARRGTSLLAVPAAIIVVLLFLVPLAHLILTSV